MASTTSVAAVIPIVEKHVLVSIGTSRPSSSRASENSFSTAQRNSIPCSAKRAIMRARNWRGQASYGSRSRRTWSTSITADRGAYGITVNVAGSGTRRISPTGPIPSTAWSWSSEFIACIATVSPTPVAIRSARCSTGTTFPRTTPPLSQYSRRTSRTPASRHDTRISSAVGIVIARQCGSPVDAPVHRRLAGLCQHRHRTGVPALTVRPSWGAHTRRVATILTRESPMSHRFIDPRPPRPRRRGWRASCGILLASITLAGVSVSVASASEPPPAHGADGPRIDADGNTVLGSSPAVESAAGDPQYIVQLEDGASLDAVVADVADVTGDGVVVADTVEGAIDGFTAALDADGLAALRRHDEVVRVEREQRYELTGIQDNPPWGLDRIDQREPSPDSRYSSRYTGAGVDVYVIDSGIRTTHGEFTGRLKPGAYMDFGDGTGIEDCNGHGTHVAGTVAGTTWGVAKRGVDRAGEGLPVLEDHNNGGDRHRHQLGDRRARGR